MYMIKVFWGLFLMGIIGGKASACDDTFKYDLREDTKEHGAKILSWDEQLISFRKTLDEELRLRNIEVTHQLEFLFDPKYVKDCKALLTNPASLWTPEGVEARTLTSAYAVATMIQELSSEKVTSFSEWFHQVSRSQGPLVNKLDSTFRVFSEENAEKGLRASLLGARTQTIHLPLLKILKNLFEEVQTLRGKAGKESIEAFFSLNQNFSNVQKTKDFKLCQYETLVLGAHSLLARTIFLSSKSLILSHQDLKFLFPKEYVSDLELPPFGIRWRQKGETKTQEKGANNSEPKGSEKLDSTSGLRPMASFKHQLIATKPVTEDHFYLPVVFNESAFLNLMVDSGATHITLTKGDARKIFGTIEHFTYPATVQTATTPDSAQSVKFDTVQIGTLSVSSLKGLVLENGTKSVLGMSFFKEGKITFTIDGNQITLQQ